MSWKIYNGFILKNITKLEDALEFVKSLSNEFAIEADDYWKGLIISYAIAQYDNDCADNTKPSKNYINESLHLFRQEERETSKSGAKSVTDTRVGVSLCSTIIHGKKRIIGMLFCDNGRLRNKFFNLEEIENYSFYDSTDKPDEVSTRDWNYRKKVWSEIFKDHDTANKVMFSYDIISDIESLRSPDIIEEDFKKYLTSFDDRLKGAVNERLIKNKTFSNLMGYLEYIRSAEAQEAKTLIEPIIKERLTINLAFNDLQSNSEDNYD